MVVEQLKSGAESDRPEAAPTSRAWFNPPMLLHDRDTKFGAAFRRTLKRGNVRPKMLPYAAPNPNTHVERFIRTLRNECLDRFVVLGLRHLRVLVREFAEHCNQERPHSELRFGTPRAAGLGTRARPQAAGALGNKAMGASPGSRALPSSLNLTAARGAILEPNSSTFLRALWGYRVKAAQNPAHFPSARLRWTTDCRQSPRHGPTFRQYFAGRSPLLSSGRCKRESR